MSNSFEDVYVVSQHRTYVAASEIDAFEQRLGFSLPLGYREALTVLGLGTFCKSVRLLEPAEIEQKLDWWQNVHVPLIISEEFFSNGPLLTAAELLQSIFFAESVAFDDFVATPSRGRAVFELPRHDSRMRFLPTGFLDPFEFCFLARERFRFPFFEPQRNRQYEAEVEADSGTDIPSVWRAIERRWGTSLRIVADDRAETIGFVGAIGGKVSLEIDRGRATFYFTCDDEYQSELDEFIASLQIAQ